MADICELMNYMLITNQLFISLQTLFLIINIVLFVVYFMKFYNGKQYYYLNQMLGLSLPFARASAGALNFNCMLILLPVCRNLITLMRGSCQRCCYRNTLRQLDKHIMLHKLCAYTICFWTAVHYFAHCFNFERFILAWSSPNNSTKELLATLSAIKQDGDQNWVNPIRSPLTNPMLELFKNIPGYTGVLITIPLIFIVTSSTELIRRSYFEVFWFTHHLFVVFFIALVTHGLGGVVRMQTNLADHDPEYCSLGDRYKYWGVLPECPLPNFQGGGAQTWKWVIGPMVLYVIERIVRFVRSEQKVTVVKVIEHPSRVVELQMQKSGFTTEPGQYVFLKCPSISHLEWHPFTLTSSPQEDFFSVHVRIAGDWTAKLAELCCHDEYQVHDSSTLPKISVDGPFGTCSEDVFRYQVDVLVAAGIGVTPFASVLKDIWFKKCDADHQMKLRKVYFYWICPDTNAFEWFVDLLKCVEDQMIEMNQADFLEINIFWTRGWSARQANIIGKTVTEETDVITGLMHKTKFGRPNWDLEFERIAQSNPDTRVGVFFCGPKVLSSTLHKMSNKYSQSRASGTNFVYNKENF
uniref:FAD-binding FR-type domain-containing protein n=1 Tax=Capitella teleta TaxID=283909 RepID=X2ATU6_CAPTE